jgi:hypothetical protein
VLRRNGDDRTHDLNDARRARAGTVWGPRGGSGFASARLRPTLAG